jgi:hypothetical protein
MSRWPVRLYNAVQRALGKLGHAPRGFRAGQQALLEAARSATGLHDFGDPGFREGLDVLLRAYDEEACLTPFGRRMVLAELTGILAARLAVEAAWKREPRILDSPIRRPIFVLGLPRTGTTALHSLLAQDPEHQVLEYWLAAAPGPRPPRSAWQRDPRFVAARRGLRSVYFLDPDLKAIHLLTPEGPDECRHLFLQSFVDHTFDSNAHIPSYTRWFASQDMRPAYARHRDILKLIGSPTPERRWVLKYPAHLRELPALLETYPDACIVQTHRDPARVLPSLCSLVVGWRSLYEDPVDARAVGRWQLDMLSDMVVGAVATRAAADPARFYDFHFDDVLSDPVGGVKRMYQHFELELSAEAERRMRAWHASHPQGQHGGHHYTAESFGLSDDEIRERFGPYIERYRVPA